MLFLAILALGIFARSLSNRSARLAKYGLCDSDPSVVSVVYVRHIHGLRCRIATLLAVGSISVTGQEIRRAPKACPKKLLFPTTVNQ